MVDRMIRKARGVQEIADMERYIQLARIEKQKGKLSNSEQKQLSRVRMRCIRAGLIQEINREQLEQIARSVYKKLPFYKRWWMRILFYYNRWVNNRKLRKLTGGDKQ